MRLEKAMPVPARFIDRATRVLLRHARTQTSVAYPLVLQTGAQGDKVFQEARHARDRRRAGDKFLVLLQGLGLINK